MGDTLKDILTKTGETIEPFPGVVSPTAPEPAATVTMITGIVTAAGAVRSGTGYGVTRTGAGAYTVTFTTAFSAVPVVLAAPLPLTGIHYLASEFTTAIPTATGFAVAFIISGGAFTDTDWNFIAQAIL